MKKEKKIVSAVPSKRLYQSIIADYSTELALSELIDNAIDVWIKNKRSQKLKVEIDMDIDQQTITVADNAGGIPEAEIQKIIAPGHTTNTSAEETIGTFGVGSKRAVVALSQEIKIFTRFHKDKTLVIEYDDDWLKQEEWDLEYHTYTPDLAESTTKIQLDRLRSVIDQGVIDGIRTHLSCTYAKFLSNSNLLIRINNIPIKPISFDSSWSYPPNYPPQRELFKVPLENGSDMHVDILGGLIGKDQIGEGEYGVYFYCNDRLILSADKSYVFGFSRGQAGVPHAQLNPMRIIVALKGEPANMPWNSSKSGINFKSKIFISIRERILQLVIYYAKLARKFVGNVEENIYQYDKGEIVETEVSDITKPLKLYHLPQPNKKINYEEVIKSKNAGLSQKKPWTTGLYEGIILVEDLFNTSFTQKNRFALIILDSTLEIAFKEYLVHFSKPKIGQGKLHNILHNRAEVEKEVKARATKITNTEWGLIQHYYLIRCNLIHQVATSEIRDDEISKYRKVVQSVLLRLFHIQF